MTLGEFRTLIRAMVPSANTGAVKNTILNTLINKGVKEVNAIAKGYCDEVYFNIEASEDTYDIRDIESSYVLIGTSGLWINNGSVASPDWNQLDACNRQFLDRNFPNWVNSGTGTPLRYIIEAGKIIVHPSPTSALTNGFWMPDFIKAPTVMSSDTDYPFTGTTDELSDLQPLDDAIVDYVRWHLKHSVGSDQKGLTTRKEFELELRRRIRMVGRRPDYKSNFRKLRMRGRKS